LDAGILISDPAPSSTAGLAIVVPVHGRPEQLTRCLEAITRTAEGATLTIVDDGSPDPEAIARVGAAHAAVVVRHPVSRGPSAARNTGFAHTDAPLVAFVDSDVVLGSGCLARLAGHFDDPATGAAAPRILGTVPGSGSIAGYEARHSSLDMGPSPARVRPWARVRYVPSATLVVRRDAFGSGFDERLLLGEDVDLVWRLAEAGWGVWYDPSVVVHHEHRSSVREFVGRRFAYATSIGPLADRHQDALPALHVDAASGVVVLALMRRPRLAACLAVAVMIRHHAQLRRRTRQPARLAVTLGSRSLIRAGRSLSHAIRQPWWPLCALAAVRSRRAAMILIGAWASGVVEAKATRPSHAALSVADDLLAGAGTWWSCLRCHTLTPVLPAHRLRRNPR
jgi:mycofactocin system glycosyltransferase